ncbi:WD40-repeat-containing domain protein [Aspergillus pseudonomiae]|uniref:WD domain protein n=2 Tax=Aspergillus subgen. Circumdati TaxID=2720871 RepID=A0A0L1INZ5_ASPN3|nr:WD domain protein [Aspergillus nomiae NRRL 13137]XP_031937328.1 WD40-repeat-containing domain protein [Aspergillus pseudonomiae]KAB8257874.1 WD40-repeat-containing domain protein [Aspergillus pseudonomiae]KAE8400009.1 WD40-repeat-containing domain protein [Aspergillus pseudonomiae]KNG81224.1 WD domain protein [Aspergillus nomiae NRRL 13137]
MNLSLLDPFVLAQDYPDTFTEKLRSGHATCLRFNRKGDYLASGRVDGTVVIFDLETNGVARKLRGHTRQIQSLSWSRNGRYLLSSSQDWKCILWDLKDGSRVRTVRFEAPVYIAELHPYNHLLFVASLFEDQPVLVDVSSPKPIKRILPSAPFRPPPPKSEEVDPAVAAKQAAQDAKHSTCVTIFTALGNHIIAGTSKGWINIIETQTCATIHSTRLCNGVVILLRLASNGRDLLVNSSDRVIRTILMPDLSQLGIDLEPANIKLQVEHKFQDVVNRLSWNHVTFSSTSEFVTASTFMNPDIYVWERSHGSLVKILEGPREELGVVEWHPSRPMVVACGLESGCIYTWSIVTPQKWSALAPDFGEVEENVEYVEREDEFDVHPAEEIHQRRLDQEDEVPDVLTIEPHKSGTDEEIESFRMPVLLDISDSESEEDIVAVGPGTMRRRSPGAGRDWANGDGEKETTGGRNGTSRGQKGRRR